MAKLILRNTDMTLDRDVRIYRVSKAGTIESDNPNVITDSESFLAVKLQRAYSVSCDGAVAHAGELTTTTAPGTTLSDGDSVVTVNDDAELMAALNNMGFNAVEVTDYNQDEDNTPA